MKKQYTVKILAALLALALALLAACAVGCKDDTDTAGNVTELSFKAAASYDYLKTLSGTQVSISGYMATSSPVDGSFLFLMNLPYQSCPFCVPNTSQLSNTMEVYPKKGETFDYTAQAIKVIGTLVVSENENEPFTDTYGYEFNYKIVDATYTVIRAEELSAELKLWQSLAASDVISDVYKMYDYVNFVCSWNTYFVNSYTDENGQTVAGYYLYPSDAEKYLYGENAQYHYGLAEGYFDGLIQRVEAIDENAFSALVENIRKAEALSVKALGELESKSYTSEYKYVEKFGREDYVYTLDRGEELAAEMQAIYSEFSAWLGEWEM